jgi:hypothetical protein
LNCGARQGEHPERPNGFSSGQMRALRIKDLCEEERSDIPELCRTV